MILRAVRAETDAAAGLIPWLGQPVLTWMGMEIMTAGGIVIIVAQVQMGASWRIGLDWERKALATEGLSRWSRSFLRPMLASSVTT
jgi:hypothetical protein